MGSSARNTFRIIVLVGENALADTSMLLWKQEAIKYGKKTILKEMTEDGRVYSLAALKKETCFEVDELDSLELNQLASWDEVHRKCHIGVGGSLHAKKHRCVIQFPRDKNGKLDLSENGDYTGRINWHTRLASILTR